MINIYIFFCFFVVFFRIVGSIFGVGFDVFILDWDKILVIVSIFFIYIVSLFKEIIY